MIAAINMEKQGMYHQTVEEIDSEVRLVQNAQVNPQLFEPLYKKYYPQIVSFIYHRIESKEDAYEITAQVFYKALENLSKYKAQGVPFSAWLFRIASNELNQLFRKNKCTRIVSISNDGLQELTQNIDESASLIADEQLFEALQQLEEEEMELIDMRYFEKRSFKEISEIKESGESAIKMRVYRILEKLKTILKNITHETI